MSMVDLTDMLRAVGDADATLCAIEATDIASIAEALEQAQAADAPLLLALRTAPHVDLIAAAAERAARRATVPTALIWLGAVDTEEAVAAIRLGCNAVVPAAGLEQASLASLEALRDACGIALPGAADVAPFAPDRAAPIVLVTTESLPRALAAGGSAGLAVELVTRCRRWRPVEHLILYNAGEDEAAAAALAADGREALSRIPGVLATLSGRALTQQARYQWCWLIRFASPAVIPSYRDHPDHVAYADNRFRPLAGDRVSIDYALFAADDPADRGQ